MDTGRTHHRDSIYGETVMTMASDGRAGDGRNRRRDAAAGGGRAAPQLRKRESGRFMADDTNGTVVAPFPATRPAIPLPEHLTRCLKAMYDDILDEPVPDRFCQLLEALDRQQGASRIC
jgi:hypothetical protein